MGIGERITQLREARDRTRYWLAQQAGTSASNIERIETGETKSPGIALLARIAAALEVSVDALLDESPIPAGIDHDAARPLVTVEVPLVATVSGGIPIDSEELRETYPVLRHLYKKGRYVLKLSGDSMFPLLHHGDLLLFEPAERVADGTIAVVRVGDESTVKRVYRRRGGGLRLEGESPSYHKELEPGQGKVLAKFITIVEGKRA